MNGDGKNYEILKRIANELGSVDYLEIGVQEGGSSEAVFSTMKVRSAVLVDTWGKEYGGTGRGSPESVNIRLRGFPGHKIFLTGDSKVILPQIRSDFNLAFVDGDHSSEGAYIDIVNAITLVAKGGSVVIDDTNHPQHGYIRKIAADIAKSLQMQIEFYDDAHEGVAVIKIC